MERYCGVMTPLVLIIRGGEESTASSFPLLRKGPVYCVRSFCGLRESGAVAYSVAIVETSDHFATCYSEVEKTSTIF